MFFIYSTSRKPQANAFVHARARASAVHCSRGTVMVSESCEAPVAIGYFLSNHRLHSLCYIQWEVTIYKNMSAVHEKAYRINSICID